MVRFAMFNTARLAMVLMVVGTWGTMAGIAKAIMRPVYRSGLVTLRTATKSRRRSKLSKVVATPFIYTMVFILMFTAFTGMGILMKDTSDFFGFQKHVLSWEYVVNPKYVALLCACALAGSGVAVATFHRNTRGAPVSPEQYDRAWKAGCVAFMGAGAVGFAFMIVLEAARASAEAPVTMPGGGAVARGIALMMAAKSPMKLLPGKTRSYAREVVDDYLNRLGIRGETLGRIRTFAHTLPNRLDEAAKSVEQRMVARGFDADTSSAVRREVREMRALARREPPRPGGPARAADLNAVAAAVERTGLSADRKEEIKRHLSEVSAGRPAVLDGVALVLGLVAASG